MRQGALYVVSRRSPSRRKATHGLLGLHLLYPFRSDEQVRGSDPALSQRIALVPTAIHWKADLGEEKSLRLLSNFAILGGRDQGKY